MRGKINIPFSILIVVFLFSSCGKEEAPDLGKYFSDEELINAISAATDKKHVKSEDLPGGILDFLDIEYSESDILIANMVPNIGYELIMCGKISNQYFDWTGRKLMSDMKVEKDCDRKHRTNTIKTIRFISNDNPWIFVIQSFKEQMI